MQFIKSITFTKKNPWVSEKKIDSRWFCYFTELSKVRFEFFFWSRSFLRSEWFFCLNGSKRLRVISYLQQPLNIAFKCIVWEDIKIETIAENTGYRLHVAKTLSEWKKYQTDKKIYLQNSHFKKQRARFFQLFANDYQILNIDIFSRWVSSSFGLRLSIAYQCF